MDSLAERFDDSFFLLMRNLGSYLVSEFPLNLTQSQFLILRFVRHEKLCTVSQISEALGVTLSNVTAMLNRLEEHGYILRFRDNSTDRRTVLNQLTKAGEEALNEVLRARKQLLEECLMQIESDELDSFVNTLEKLASIVTSKDINTQYLRKNHMMTSNHRG